MYSKLTISGPILGGGAALPFTGSSYSLVWLVLAAFALLTAGGALIRIAPSMHPKPTMIRGERRVIRQPRVHDR